MTTTLLHHLNDYAPSGLEFAEIKTQFINHLNNPHQIIIHDTAIPPLDTIGLGFVTGQLALTPFKHRLVVYGNCAPRRSTKKATKNNLGQGLKYALLKNGAEIINVFSEYAFGFVKNDIVKFHDLNIPNQGSQFRSRDFFPKAVANIINSNYSDLGKKLNLTNIPAIAPNLVAWTDGFGNIKTTPRLSHLTKLNLKPGDKVKVVLNNVAMIGVISLGGFQVDRGVLAINAGSSGHHDPFIELFLRVHHLSEKTAAVRFNHPTGGQPLELKPL